MVSLLSAEWLYLVVAIGIISTIIVTIITIHSTINQRKEAIGNIWSRILYILFYLSGCITCMGFAFLRTNLILPMGTTISCHIGYYLTINGVYISKLLLFIIFLYRIDLAFHQSALAYHRGFLACVMTTYMIVISVLNGFYCVICWPLINFQQLTEQIGICTTLGIGTDQQHSKRRLSLAALSLFDILFSIFVCSLFVYKLRVVIKMSKQDNGHVDPRDFTLVVLARKQTMLVILACFTSLLSIGMAVVVSGSGLIVTLDITFNIFCVWLMFNFTQKYWKLFIKYVCCCCYCINKITKKYAQRKANGYSVVDEQSEQSTSEIEIQQS